MTLNGQTLVGTGETVVDALGTYSVDAKERIHSILRIVGDFTYRCASSNAEVAGRIGFHVVSDDALAGLVVPDPALDSESDWMYNRAYSIDAVSTESRKFEIDNRSARRLPGGESTLAFIIEGVIPTNSLVWGVGVRLLLSFK